MAALLTDFGLVVDTIITMAGSVIGLVVGAPLLLIPIAIGFLGAGIGLVKTFKG